MSFHVLTKTLQYNYLSFYVPFAGETQYQCDSIYKEMENHRAIVKMYIYRYMHIYYQHLFNYMSLIEVLCTFFPMDTILTLSNYIATIFVFWRYLFK